MIDDNILFLKEFIGTEWLSAEFKKINTKTPLKGAGARFETCHPWVHFLYEMGYLLRRADIENRDNVMMGRYHYILNNAGALLRHNLDYIIDKKEAQMKLRNPEQFYDFIWELETRTMLSQCGACATFIDPQSGNTYDGSVTINNRQIPFECKNKVLDNDRYNTNSIFSQVLANKLGDVTSIQNKIIQIEFEDGRLEDVKIIVATIRDKFDVYNYKSILGRYKVRTLKKLPFNTPPQCLMNRNGISAVFEIGKRKESELYLDSAPSHIDKTKLLIKMPDPVSELHNLNGVLKKANSQLSPGGIVFLQVPHTTFESAKSEIKKEIFQCFSNIYAVKLISLDISFKENQGVKISHYEDLIVSPRGNEVLSQEEIGFLNQPMVFSKYAKRKQLEQ